MRRGFLTSEFLFSGGVALFGAFLVLAHHDVWPGTALILGATVSYALARGTVKGASARPATLSAPRSL